VLLTSRLRLAPHEPTGTGRHRFLDAERLHLADSAIPPELAAIIERALREDPTGRFPDVAAMRPAFEGQLARQTRQLVVERKWRLAPIQLSNWSRHSPSVNRVA